MAEVQTGIDLIRSNPNNVYLKTISSTLNIFYEFFPHVEHGNCKLLEQKFSDFLNEPTHENFELLLIAAENADADITAVFPEHQETFSDLIKKMGKEIVAYDRNVKDCLEVLTKGTTLEVEKNL